MVFDHAGAVGLTEHHQGHAARRPHGLPLEDGGIAAGQLWAERMGEKRGEAGARATYPALPLPAHRRTSPSTLSVAMHLCPALSLMRSILGASMRQLHRGNSSNPRSVSSEDVSLDTPSRNKGAKGGPAPHPLGPPAGPFTPTLPAFLSMLQNPQSLAMDIP